MARIDTERGARSRATGATLVELVVAMLLVAALATLALPGYRAHVLRTHRVEARHALLSVAAAQERYYLRNNTYASGSALAVAPPGGLGIPPVSPNGWYVIAIEPGTDASGFTATATAQGAQRDDTACAQFSIDATGQRLARDRGGEPARSCWN